MQPWNAPAPAQLVHSGVDIGMDKGVNIADIKLRAAAARRARHALASSIGRNMSVGMRRQRNGSRCATAGAQEVQSRPGTTVAADPLSNPARTLPTTDAWAALRAKNTLQPVSPVALSRTGSTEHDMRRPASAMDTATLLRNNAFRVSQAHRHSLSATASKRVLGTGLHKAVGNVGRGNEVGLSVAPDTLLAFTAGGSVSAAAPAERLPATGRMARTGFSNGAFDASGHECLTAVAQARWTSTLVTSPSVAAPVTAMQVRGEEGVLLRPAGAGHTAEDGGRGAVLYTGLLPSGEKLGHLPPAVLQRNVSQRLGKVRAPTRPGTAHDGVATEADARAVPVYKSLAQAQSGEPWLRSLPGGT